LLGKTRNSKPKPKTYSLWLMPSGQVYRRLRGAILRLSRIYSTPVFKPHVTLLGRIVGPQREVLAKCAQLVRGMRPLVVRLSSLDGFGEYYRCLFVRVAKTGPLRKAYRAARRIFNIKKRPAYMPHLSLMYGDFPPRLKAQIIRKLGGRFNLEFEVRSLHLYSTTGKPRAWRQVKAFGLG
jgi:2'-5' RNA ligase